MSALPQQNTWDTVEMICIQCAHKVYIEGFKLRCEETGDTREYDDESCTFAQTCEEVRAERHMGKRED